MDFVDMDDLKQGLSKTSVQALLLVNLIPLFGVIFFGWDMLELLLLYWSESGAIGFYMLLKLAVFTWESNPDPKEKPSLLDKFSNTTGIVLFFIIHFGAFMVGHLIFILGLLAPPGSDPIAIFSPLLYGTLAFFLSHGASFVTNYLFGKEYKSTDIGKLTLAPYTRIVIMQVAIIFGIGLTFWMVPLGIPPIGPLLIIIAAKTLADINGHLQEHIKPG